ncbi:MAG: hypothetical protein JO352_24970 [Chloroflexi bacterium]|nr:hypothetical protein [Chloroflexota bacterium]
MNDQSQAQEWENVELMTDDQIDYSLLPETQLYQLGSGSDVYVGQSALRELHRRGSGRALELAIHILNEPDDDAFLKATALRVLFESDERQALDFMRSHIENSPGAVVNKMMELLAYPTDIDQPPTPDEIEVARMIKSRLPAGFADADAIRVDVEHDFSLRFSEA